MDLVHDFTVPVSTDQAFDLLVDISRIAPCMPGANVTSVEGDTFQGGMKVKVGPISMTFKGAGEMVEIDRPAKRAVLRAKGRDAKGNGGAEATVTATLEEIDGSTTVHVVTDLNVTGKAAQFGGGVMKDISNRLFQQFADNLADMVQTGGGTGSAPPEGGPAPIATPQPASKTSGEGVDALGLLLGSQAVRNGARSTALGLLGVLTICLLARNRALKKRLRRVGRMGLAVPSLPAGR